MNHIKLVGQTYFFKIIMSLNICFTLFKQTKHFRQKPKLSSWKTNRFFQLNDRSCRTKPIHWKACVIANVNIRIAVCKWKYPNVNVKRFTRQILLNAPISSLGESETFILPSVFISCSWVLVLNHSKWIQLTSQVFTCLSTLSCR